MTGPRPNLLESAFEGSQEPSGNLLESAFDSVPVRAPTVNSPIIPQAASEVSPDGLFSVFGKKFTQGALTLPSQILNTVAFSSDIAKRFSKYVNEKLEPVLSPNDVTGEGTAYVGGEVLGNMLSGFAAYKGVSSVLKLGYAALPSNIIARFAIGRIASVADNVAARVAARLSPTSGAVAGQMVKNAPLALGTNTVIQALADPESLTTVSGVGNVLAQTLLGSWLEGKAKINAAIRDLERATTPEQVAAIVGKTQDVISSTPLDLNFKNPVLSELPDSFKIAFGRFKDGYTDFKAAVEHHTARVNMGFGSVIQGGEGVLSDVTPKLNVTSIISDKGFSRYIDKLENLHELGTLIASDVAEGVGFVGGRGLTERKADLNSSLAEFGAFIERARETGAPGGGLNWRDVPIPGFILDVVSGKQKIKPIGSGGRSFTFEEYLRSLGSRDREEFVKEFTPEKINEIFASVKGGNLTKTPIDQLPLSLKAKLGYDITPPTSADMAAQPPVLQEMMKRDVIKDYVRPSALATKLKEIGSRPREAFIDKFNETNIVGKVINPKTGETDIHAATQLTNGVGKQVEDYLELAPLIRNPQDGGFVPNINKPSMKKIMEPITTRIEQTQLFYGIMGEAHKDIRNKNLRWQSPMTDAEAQQASDIMRANPKLSKVSDEYFSATKDLYSQFTNLFGDEKIAQDIFDRQHYASLRRLMDDVEVDVKAPDAYKNLVGQGETALHKDVKRGNAALSFKNPLLTFKENAEMLFAADARNKVITRLTDWARSNETEARQYGVRLEKTPNIQEQASSIGAVKQSWEAQTGQSLNDRQAIAFASIFTPIDIAKGTAIGFQNGIPIRLKIDNPDLMRALSYLKPEEVSGLMRILGIPAHILKFGVTANPMFSIYNKFRDVIEATAKGEDGYTPLLHPIDQIWKPFISAIQKDASYQYAMASGAGFSGQIGSQFGVTKGIRSLENIPSIHPKDILTLFTRFASPFEESTRVGQFMQSIKSGKTAEHAALSARRVTTDFAQSGASLQGILQMIPFANPAIQSTARDYEVAFKEGRGAQFAVKAIAAITIPTVTLWLANRHDQEINDLRKGPNGNLYWFIRMPEGGVIKLPKPFFLGQAFGTVMENMLDRMGSEDPQGFDKLATQLVQSASPAIMPTVAKIPIDLMTNKDTHFGMPIIPAGQERVDPRYQDSEYTSGVAKKIAQVTGISPFQIDYVMRNLGGTLTSETARAIGLPFKENAPAMTAGQLPFIGRLFADYPSRSVQPIVDFYDSLEKTQMVFNTVELLETRAPQQVSQYIQANQNKFITAPIYTQAKREIDDIQSTINQMRTIDEDNLDGKIKRAIIIYLQKQIIMTARTTNSAVKNIH